MPGSLRQSPQTFPALAETRWNLGASVLVTRSSALALPAAPIVMAANTQGGSNRFLEPANSASVATDGQIYIGTNPHSSLLLAFYGTGDDTDTLQARVWSLRQIEDSPLVLPNTMLTLTATLGQFVGVAGQLLTDTVRFADLITIAAGEDLTASPGAQLKGIVDNGVAWVEIPASGTKYYRIDLTRGGTGSTNATACGVLWATC